MFDVVQFEQLPLLHSNAMWQTSNLEFLVLGADRSKENLMATPISPKGERLAVTENGESVRERPAATEDGGVKEKEQSNITKVNKRLTAMESNELMPPAKEGGENVVKEKEGSGIVKAIRTKRRQKRIKSSSESADKTASVAPTAIEPADNIFTSILIEKQSGPKLADSSAEQLAVRKKAKKRRKMEAVSDQEQSAERLIKKKTAEEGMAVAAHSNSEYETSLAAAECAQQEGRDIGAPWQRLDEMDEQFAASQNKMGDGTSEFCTVCGSIDKRTQTATIDFEKMPFSKAEDSVHNGLDAFQWLIRPFSIKSFFEYALVLS
ncbi:unnamed protein product [Gongylonema pulchrum]|uniref:General transcription factor 3C polypeptide 2 n=1 Tax=Gongylonema pulchrum TaxID=637853 RepID=A0A183EP57_9BILA|nr:unnamed protein product [Gongylonema pulchrum]